MLVRVHAQLVAWPENTRMTSAIGIHGWPCKKRHGRAKSGQQPTGIANHLQRGFTATEPETAWIKEITKISISTGNLYIRVVIDF